MTHDVPIACSLSAAELPQRLAKMRAIGQDAVLSASADGVMRFRASTAIRARLEAVIAAEAICCVFLDLELREEGGELVLTITAPEGAEALAGDLVGAFSGQLGLDPCAGD